MPRCLECSYETDKTFNLKRHKKKAHSGETSSAHKKSYVCQMCDETAPSREELIHHVTTVHDVVIEEKNLQFENHDAFLEWKAGMEKETVSRFVQVHGVRQFKNCKINLYRCNRDGFFSSRSKGKRRLKTLGSNKINGCCPARIKATTLDCGSVIVVFGATHWGHEHDLRRFYLSKDERKEIAAEIATGVPYKEILKGVRNSVSHESLNFGNLLTSKDLWNIGQEFHLNKEAVRDQNGYASVHSWVLENEGNQVVRLYKQRGVLLSSLPELSSDDFILIIANDLQLSMLEQFGSDCVCVDRTYELNQSSDFELTTIMILDQERQSFPCAFMLSNRTDSLCMKIFFSVIKDELNGPIPTHAFMSDMAEAYSNAWAEVMSPPVNEFFSTWHVDRAWKENLSKVSDDVGKAEVYKILRALLEETDEDAFERLLELTLLRFERDPAKCEFGEYFKADFETNSHKWAFCYRAHFNPNTNTQLEGLHKTIKRCYIGSKGVKRFDKCINVLMRLVRDKLFKRRHMGKHSTTKSDIRQEHEAAKEMKDVQLIKTDEGWTCFLGSSPSANEIVLFNAECTCSLRCDHCGICLHTYTCDCLDSSIKWVICRHIHFLAMNSTVEIFEQIEEHRSCESELDIEETQDSINEDVSQPQDASAELTEKKDHLIDRYRSIVQSVQSFEELEVCEKALLPIMPAIEAVRSTDVVSSPTRQRVNILKKIPLQNTIFSAKNKRQKIETIFYTYNLNDSQQSE